MLIQQPGMNKIAFIDGHLVDMSGIDKEDVNIILQEKGMIPLSRGEREYLEALHRSLETTTLLLESLLPAITTNPHISKEQKDELEDEIMSVIEENEGVLSVTINDIGHGHHITRGE